MITKQIYLSYKSDPGMQTYGTLPAPQITQYKSIAKGDSCNIYSMTVCNHCGTHVDAPAHFMPNGRKISEYTAGELIFNKPMLADIPKKPGEWIEKQDVMRAALDGIDCLLIRTGFGAFRGQDIYKTNNPGISPEAIGWLRQHVKTLRCIGIDAISISNIQNRERGRMAHKTAFETVEGASVPLLILEDADLTAIQSNCKLKKIIIAPWLIAGIDSAPCTVIAEVATHG